MTTLSGLQRAATVSFLIHLALIGIFMLATNSRNNFVMPPAYTVSLVSPPGKGSPRQHKARWIPPAKTLGAPAEEEEGVTLAEETKPKKPAPEPKKKAPEKTPEKTIDTKTEKIEEMRARKEMQQYVQDKKSALLALKKLRAVKRLGHEKALVKITTRPGAGAAGVEGAQGSAMLEYTQLVTALIQQEWIFLDASAGDIWATLSVRIMRSGALILTDVERSSGNALFDRNAERAIRKASPVPPPPFQMELGVNFYPAGEDE